MTGLVCARLTVLRRAGRDDRGGIVWRCRCECGVTTNVAGHLLRRGQVKSCGCLRAEVGARQLRKFRTEGRHGRLRHGDARAGQEAPEWRLWHSIKRRCDPKSKKLFPNYAGRGIEMWKPWRDSYERFLRDIGRRPSDQHTLDRRNNDGHYKPGNVRWATRKEQARNRSNSCYIKCGKERRTLAEWSEITGLKNTTILARIRAGWPVVIALSHIPWDSAER